MEIAPKLKRLITMTMKRTSVSIKTQLVETEEYDTNRDIRQGASFI